MKTETLVTKSNGCYQLVLISVRIKEEGNDRIKIAEKYSALLMDVVKESVKDVLMVDPDFNVGCLTSLRDDKIIFKAFLYPRFYDRYIGRLVKEQNESERIRLTNKVESRLPPILDELRKIADSE